MKVPKLNTSLYVPKSIIKSVSSKTDVEPFLKTTVTETVTLIDNKRLEIKTDYFLNKKYKKTYRFKSKYGFVQKFKRIFYNMNGKKMFIVSD